MSKILTTYPDEYIEHWGNVFLSNPGLRRRGVLFAAFLVAPEEILAAAITPQAAEPDDLRPLLPAQLRVRRQQDWVVELASSIARLRNREMEPSCTHR